MTKGRLSGELDRFDLEILAQVSNTWRTIALGVEAGAGHTSRSVCHDPGTRRANTIERALSKPLSSMPFSASVCITWGAEAADRAFLDGEEDLVLARQFQDQIDNQAAS